MVCLFALFRQSIHLYPHVSRYHRRTCCAITPPAPSLRKTARDYLGAFGVIFGGGGMASSRRSDMKMPAIATAQTAREILRRVLTGRATVRWIDVV